MDILGLVRSLEEFLYEAMTWLLFYPRTLWRVIVRPLALAAEADEELGEDLKRQFTNLISPPLFLMLSVLIAHLFEVSLHLSVVKSTSSLAQNIFSSDTHLLLFRSVTFSLYPLLIARGLLKRQDQAVDRLTLRRPFFLQCYFAGPFALTTSMGVDMIRVPHLTWQVAGAAVGLVGAIWYLVSEARWFRDRLGVGILRGGFIALKLTLGAALLSLAIAAVIFAPDLSRSVRDYQAGAFVKAATRLE